MEATTGICWAPQLRGEIFDVEANLEDHQQISTAVQAVRAHYASLAEAPGVPLERLAKRSHVLHHQHVLVELVWRRRRNDSKADAEARVRNELRGAIQRQ